MIVPSMFKDAYTLIEEQILASDAANIIFNFIPDHFEHLFILGCGTTTNAFASNGALRINDDTAANYHRGRVYCTSPTTVVGDGAVGQTSMLWSGFGGNHDANQMTTFMIEFPYYANTDVNKAIIAHSFRLDSTQKYQLAEMGMWTTTSTIEKIDLYDGSSGNWDAGARASLYGIK